MKGNFTVIISLILTIQVFGIQEKAIDSLFSVYATNMVNYAANKESKAAYRNLTTIFSSLHDSHENDLFGNEIACEILTYLRYVKDNFNQELEVSINDKKVLKCIKYVDGEKKYRFVTFTKTTKYQQKKATLPYLMVVDISLPHYKIAGLYILLEDTKNLFLKQCPPDEAPDNGLEFKTKQRLLALHLSNAKNELANRAHIKANKLYKEALRIDPTNTRALRGIKQTRALISIKDNQKYVLNLLEDTKFNAALKALSEAQLEGVRFDPKWVNEIKLRCERGNRKLDSDHYKKEGDAMFTKGNYAKARSWYQKFLGINPERTDIMARVEICKTKDPVYAQKALDKAFLEALESTDAHLNTFYTYFRYGDSGHLRGEQLDFMVRMLLKHRGKIRRRLDYSKDEINELIKKYYFLTKDRGYYNSDLRNLIPNYLTYER
jgi:tetratricopeptide (TPR) repeat protein